MPKVEGNTQPHEGRHEQNDQMWVLAEIVDHGVRPSNR